MNTETNPISARESVRVDKEIQQIKAIVDKYDSYFYSKDQIGTLRLMQEEIASVFDEIFRRNDK